MAGGAKQKGQGNKEPAIKSSTDWVLVSMQNLLVPTCKPLNPIKTAMNKSVLANRINALAVAFVIAGCAGHKNVPPPTNARTNGGTANGNILAPIEGESALDARPNFPITYSYHAHQGNSALDAGRHAESTIKLSADGRMDIVLHIRNRVALVGYCFNVAYFLEDASGNVIGQYNAPQSCVDGTMVIFGGPSNRQLLLNYQISGDILKRVDHLRVVAGPGHRSPTALLADAIDKGIGIVAKFKK